ncbi:MAG TPA: alpha-ketoglutarate-dependent dioxygenase AlkB [Mesorhizobium sp.]|uniref:alpha-ketoglutarate-dependent dioxygenase AlkB n=1 Tax=Mesorhizobium sp. TaxID=1871066 RepID=UPI002DDCFD1F|nr:alpha-ketoglutarate-dependent dioxygenase AlkB [Mesorhizobium sp.]HEV2503726.1 alpha-ketoglutarate-dependent dioxygenase AlkB [Mesorhizobium sp.]
MPDQLHLFAEESEPQGFRLIPDFIGVQEEHALVGHLQKLPLAPFQFGAFEGKRRVASFGWRYDYSLQKLEQANGAPKWLLPLAHRVEEHFHLPHGAIRQFLCTEYDEGTGIGWHRDKPHFDEIFGLSLASPCTLRFRRKVRTSWQRLNFETPPRSLYRMSGASRHLWEHSIAPVHDRRYSITFRTMQSA